MTFARIILSLASLGFVCVAEDFNIIKITALGPTKEEIRIDRPDPTRRATDYPTITFQPGDLVRILAGGCVQSGGHGNTWHRYVNPSGGDADKLYHGLITIPFATSVLERIQKYQNQQVQVSPNAPAGNIHLQLGFEDDGYSDNGYYSHDDGPDNQCAGTDGGAAWVDLLIEHHPAGGTISTGTGDWDLVWNNFDDNGIPLNPNWRSNVEKKQLPDPGSCAWPWNGSGTGKVPCTNQITNTDTYFLCEWFSSNFGFGGHANWTVATHTGTVTWEEKSIPTQDDEYSVNLTTPGNAGATKGRLEGVHVEFDSDETIDVLTDDFKMPWWTAFRAVVDARDSAAHSYLDGKAMIVTGLMGVDFAHTPNGESHPAWTVAIQGNLDPADDTWAMFVRNWGNEGYCSGDQHLISFVDNQYTFRLPWPKGALSGSVNLNATDFRSNNSAIHGPFISFIPGVAVLATFQNLPDPSVHALIGGELHLKWVMPPTPPGTRSTTTGIITGIRGTVATTPGEPERAESFVSGAVSKLTPAQRAAFLAAAPKKTRKPGPSFKLQATVGTPPVKLNAAQHPTIRAVADPALVANKTGQVEALQKAYGGTIPGTPARAQIVR
jgi:hypothetical protein